MNTTLDQLIATQATIAGILDVHAKAFETEFDEAWGTNPICDQCRRMYPCDLRVALTDVPLDALAARERETASAAFTEAAGILAKQVRESSYAIQHCDNDQAAGHSAVADASAALADALYARATAVRATA